MAETVEECKLGMKNVMFTTNKQCTDALMKNIPSTFLLLGKVGYRMLERVHFCRVFVI